MMNTALPTKKKVVLLGAFDRFNYGDLLFPIVVNNEITANNNHIQSEVYALAKSDLSRYGALKTSPLKLLYKHNTIQEDDVIIFAGGGTIGADWLHMHSNLVNSTGNLALYYLMRVCGNKFANKFSQYYFGGRTLFPWVAVPSDFSKPVKVAYNAVGGSELANLNKDAQAHILNDLTKASYISVRDAETKRLLAPVENSICIELAPDSAILMSEQFPVSELLNKAGNKTREQINEAPYLCFQSNDSYASAHIDGIISMLESAYRVHGLRTLLLPIGRYTGLSDHIALSKIRNKLSTPAAIISSESSIWEIMLTIAKAKIFLGTSLHGNVTSQSFAVPHLGLSEKPSKLDFYLGTWDLKEQSKCMPLNKVNEQISKVLAVPNQARQALRNDLIARSHQNFAKMAKACGISYTSS